MCGRFSFQPSLEMLQALAEDKNGTFATGDVIVPEMDILIYTPQGLDVAKWGFKPEWGDTDFKASTHNARSETVAEKATFRGAWEAGQRCIIPANYFFEWQHGTKLGFTVHPTDQDFLYFAGLWEKNQHGFRCTILTKASGDNVRQYHRRMPMMMKRAWLPQWIKGNHQDALEIVSAANDENLDVRSFIPDSKQARLF